MSAADNYRLEPDRWLGGILGRPAWNVVQGGAGGAPLAELRKPGPQLATAKVDARDTGAVAQLESLGFRLVDAALGFEAAAPQPAASAPSGIRFAKPEDRSRVEAIAESAFTYSRFHMDARLPRALANRVKAAWAANWFLGERGDGMVLAANAAGEVAGFLLLRWAPQDCLVIDLIAVQPKDARQGLARAMIAFAQARGTGDARRPQRLRVGTQAANVPSVRLYESLGFRLCEAKFVLHHHGEAA